MASSRDTSNKHLQIFDLRSGVNLMSLLPLEATTMVLTEGMSSPCLARIEWGWLSTPIALMCNSHSRTTMVGHLVDGQSWVDLHHIQSEYTAGGYFLKGLVRKLGERDSNIVAYSLTENLSGSLSHCFFPCNHPYIYLSHLVACTV